MTQLIIVESPAKAKALTKYLQGQYQVIASVGHLRALPQKRDAVNTEDFSLQWENLKGKSKVLQEIKKCIKSASNVILATDPDREGEAIAWHISQIYEDLNTPFERIRFNDISKKSILEALEHRTTINHSLVEAYLARISLDYLVGFSISPVLWRKLPNAMSAGRVQTTVLRLICEREEERENFVPEKYWQVACVVKHEGIEINATNNIKTQNKQEAENFVSNVPKILKIIDEPIIKEIQKSPRAPFITSTLQQEAYSNLKFSTIRTMKIAQELYESIEYNNTTGLITYMRTDGFSMNAEFQQSACNYITNKFSEKYLQKRVYGKKVANAQEAHECIRPIEINNTPEKLKNILTTDQLKLYTLIWQRTIMSQMSDSVYENIKYKTDVDELKINFTIQKFDGFEVILSKEKSNAQVIALKTGDQLQVVEKQVTEHTTQAPARYTESSIIKKMEELGIGRPSTYAHIIQILKKRNYTSNIKGSIYPFENGRMLVLFMKIFFSKYITYEFTSMMEQQLDDITKNKLTRHELLKNFCEDFFKTIKTVMEYTSIEVCSQISEQFYKKEQCPKCIENNRNGELVLKKSKNGLFFACSQYPDCKFAKSPFTQNIEIPKLSDVNTEIKNGMYGWYIAQKQKDNSFKNTSIYKHIDITDISDQNVNFIINKTQDITKDITMYYNQFGIYIKNSKNKKKKITLAQATIMTEKIAQTILSQN